MARAEAKIKDGTAPYLESGEEVLAAIVARPRGWTQSNASPGRRGHRRCHRAARWVGRSSTFTGPGRLMLIRPGGTGLVRVETRLPAITLVTWR